jgi:endonuclease/exonuclease/phosphatase family metal-dependent hydrolase
MQKIAVMSFNIHGETFDDEGVNVWANRAPLIARVIRQADPDLIGMLEVVSENFDYFADALPDYEHTMGESYGEIEYPAYNPIFWYRERFEHLERGLFWLSRTPDQPSVDWGVDYPLVVNWVKLRRKSDGLTLIHYNTHLEDGDWGETQRVESSKLIASRAAKQQADGSPLILSGDFNTNPSSDTYRILQEAGFIDVFLAAGNEDGNISTFHGFEGEAYDTKNYGGPDAEPFWRVDWILLRQGAQPLHIDSCTVITEAEPPLYPSDHYPVLAEFSKRLKH